MYPNQINSKPTLNLNLGLEALGKRKNKYMHCPDCPAHLNTNCKYTEDYAQAINGTKIRKS